MEEDDVKIKKFCSKLGWFALGLGYGGAYALACQAETKKQHMKR